MEEFKHQISGIESKIKTVSEFVLELKLQLQHQEQELQNLQSSIANKEAEVLQLQSQLKQQNTVNALAGNSSEGQKEAKLKINELVREIDRCIALLNK